MKTVVFKLDGLALRKAKQEARRRGLRLSTYIRTVLKADLERSANTRAA
jgi:predicted DNA binding CopG/RHH family protein